MGKSYRQLSVEERTMLIRLDPKPTRSSGSGFCGIKFGIGGRGDIAGDAQQGAECVERIEAAVEAKSELV